MVERIDAARDIGATAMDLFGYLLATAAVVLVAVLLWRLDSRGGRAANDEDDASPGSSVFAAQPIDHDHHDGSS